VTARLVVLASGGGSNFQAILDGCASGRIDAQVVGLVANRQCGAVDRAGAAGIPWAIEGVIPGQDRRLYDDRLAGQVLASRPDWVVLAGWMRILTSSFLDVFPNRVVNLHPALPGEFPGTHAIERAWKAAAEGGLHHTGVMVHLVPDERVDEGPVLATAEVPLIADEPLEALEQRMHAAEHELLVDTLARLCRGELP
jgi:phosphoribosylglycinamide formyltransferase 1